MLIGLPAPAAAETHGLPRAGDLVGPVAPPPFALAELTRESFLERRTALIADLTGTAGKAGDRGDLLMRLAELYLAQGLAPEGRSVIERLEPDRLSPRQGARLDALRMAFDTLGGQAPEPLDERFGSWPDRPLWAALRHIGAGDMTTAGPDLQRAFNRLEAYPPAFDELVLPRLLEAAVETGQWQLARAMAAEAEANPVLRNEEEFGFLLGLAAERNGKLVAALDAYRETAAGTGRAAARARLALIRMGRDTGTLTPEEERELLDQSAALWRGDALELETLIRLARVQHDLGTDVESLETIARLRERFPNSDEADTAGDWAAGLLRDWYDRGASGAIPAGAYMAGHVRLARRYRFFPGYDRSSERFADRMLELGATAAAEREYGLTRDHLKAAEEVELANVTPRRLEELRLKRAEALEAGGQAEEALALLAAQAETDDASLADRRNLMRARLHEAAGHIDAVLETRVAQPSPDYLRILARAHYAQGDWTAARDTYARLRASGGISLDRDDAINLLLAAYRLGDQGTVRTLAAERPELTEIPKWKEIAGELSDAPQGPLRRQAAKDTLQEAGDTLQSLQAATRGSEG